MKFEIHQPWGLTNETIDGIFLLDSFGQTKWKDAKYSYVAQALQYVWWQTGHVCIAIQANGAGYATLLLSAQLARGFIKKRQASYEVRFAVIISMGNDVYGMRTCVASAIAHGMAEVCNCVQEYTASRALVIYGGSSHVWGYEGTFAETYDDNVDAVIKILRDKYETLAIKGTRLGALQTTDRIGHVHIAALPAVVNMYCKWARLAMAMNQSSRL